MKRVLSFALGALVVLLALVLYFGLREDAAQASPSPAAPGSALLVRGEYLARVGDCLACHTARGGAAYAGGRAIQTPFGAIPAPNITPDPDTGIGRWSADDFWRALHDGKSKDGRLLYPAFPYPDYTRINRADADALFAYLKTVSPVRQENAEPQLRFPFSVRPLLVFWRALYFRPGEYRADASQSAEWNRGAYLVQGAGHCGACHTPHNFLGATRGQASLAGAMIPMLNWYASALNGDPETGLGSWSAAEVATLLKTGVSVRGAAAGPMAEVVRQSLQYLTPEDAQAMAVYLKSLPASGAERGAPARAGKNEAMLAAGKTLYGKHCAECHKDDGQGLPPDYPPLAGNRAVRLQSAVNPIRLVLHGGYAPSTAGNPRPYGMPPFAAVLSDEEIAAVVSYIRDAWGNQASPVTSDIVNRFRTVTLD